jgi:endonuclease YncB( thermonuclease family)
VTGALIAVLAGMAACSAFAPAPGLLQAGSSVGGGDTFAGTVTKVVDGDTYWISSADVRIRVWGRIISCSDCRGTRPLW